MRNEQIIEILESWNFWTSNRETGIERTGYLDKLERLSRTGQIIAITGARRTGKSTLMKQFITKKISSGTTRRSILYINFEDPGFSGMLSLEFLQQMYDAYIEIIRPEEKVWIFLDEVQTVPLWEKFVRSLHEKNEAHIFVSGSTSRLLSKDLGTLLTGRWLDLNTYPLDFKEYLLFKQINIEDQLDIISQKTKIRQYLREYLEFGGFPLVALNEEKKEILIRYFNDIIEKDIAMRQKVRKPDKLKSLARYYLTNFSSRISYRRIAKYIGLSLDSVGRFSDHMKEAYLVFFVPKFSYSLKEQEVNLRTVYAIDAGLVNIAGFRFSENIGKLYENAVFLSLIKKGKDIYYHKTDRSECDFVIKEGQKITEVIQVSYELKENKDREIRGLLDAMDAYSLKEGFIITEDQDDEMMVGSLKIIIRPLWKWLLDL